MAGEIEAAADHANAALLADVIDTPAAGGASPTAVCANCGAPLPGNFCGNCGQKAHLHRSPADVGHEFVHGITHFYGKAWKTFPMLLLHPGRLTREYIMGHRARYIAPVPLFLLVVFLMFFVFSFVLVMPLPTALTPAQTKAQIIELDCSIADIDRDLLAARKNNDRNRIATITGIRSGLIKTRDAVRQGVAPGAFDIPAEISREFATSDLKVNLGNETINQKARHALKNPELVLYKIQGKAYKLSFLLVPLSLPWLWLMFAWKRDVRLYDHAIFALYSISFMSLLFVVGSLALAAGIGFGLFWFLLVFAIPVAHMYVQLKGAYALGRFGAGWRTIALAFASVITLGIYAVIMIVLGVVD
ncbi:hypothetical protein GCM10011529_21940 [Polymorphobacter glacialis]|uniref:DUF3667 domain-containing protein n=1 Tax=Sandarakinorhabdus glacialis TaxID=1614636 RepID=A0A917EAH2_9SPHN|nr:DUF3667 domain-containing protein [Polymorphobacter glacialis]GGE15156.1 hypothetical protein GCM10011529_21940 [Polymorphobacter glacialis]